MLFIYSFHGDLYVVTSRKVTCILDTPPVSVNTDLYSFSCFIGSFLLERLHDIAFIHQSLPACKGGKAYYFGQSQYCLNSKY